MKPILLIIIERLEGIFDIFTVNKFVYLLSFGISEEYDILYDILVEVVVSFLLSSMTLVIIITPLVLIYSWVYYSWKYVKNFKRNKGLRQILIEKDHIDIDKIPRSSWPKYREVYSRMIGFAIAIIAYAVSSNVYMFKTFDEIKVALKEYYSFPFKVFKGLNTVDEVSNYTIPLKEVWIGMLLIVCISFVVYYLVYFIVKSILNIKFNRKTDNSILPIQN